jgi:hypothetical protein
MKTYKVMRGYAPVGSVGEKVKLKDDKFTNSLLSQGIIAELKVTEPTEKKKSKPRVKKAD